MFDQGFNPGKRIGKKIGFIIIPLLFMAGNVSGQDISVAVKISMDDAVSKAIESNYQLENARLDIEMEQKLNKTTFTLPPPELAVDLGQINSNLYDRSLSISQSFSFPTIYTSQGKLNRERVDLMEVKYSMTKSELTASVMSLYSSWLLYHEQIKLIYMIDSIYQDFLAAAEARFASGDINGLEMVMAETKAAVIMNTYQSVHTEMLISENDLKTLMNSTNNIEPGDNSMIRLTLHIIEDSTGYENNPYLAYIKQYAEVQTAVVKNEGSQYLPDFSIGYFNQTIDKVKGFDGVQLGMTFPIWFWSQSGKVKAAKIERDKAENHLYAEMRRTETEISNQFKQLEKYTYILDYYEDKALRQANIILEHSLKSFSAGNINYIEYANASADAFDIKMEYLDAINNFNQTVIRINYLIGNYQ
jgi:cobalt-zinc-cadmium resistance protein CzcA